jgi:hypothetical protein
MAFKPTDFIPLAAIILSVLVSIKKNKWAIGVLIVVVLGYLAYAFFTTEEKPSPPIVEKLTTASTGKGSPAVNQSVTATGNTVTVNQVGVSQNNYYQDGNSNDLKTIKEGIESIQTKMNALNKSNGPELLDKYNLGYILFTVTTNKEFFPSQPHFQRFEVNWANTNYFVEMDRDKISIHMPDIAVFPSGGLIRDQLASLTRTVGASVGIYTDHEIDLIVEVVQTQSDGVVLVLGGRTSRIPFHR